MRNYLTFFLLLSLFWFTKAQAHVELNYPEGGETFFSGDSIVIKWTEVAAHDAENWELYFSPDGGSTWDTISANIPYSVREYNWAVPFNELSTGRIKVIQNNSGTDYEDVCPNFSIDNITGVKQNQSSSILFDSFKVAPNPVHSIGNLSFTIDFSEGIAFTFYNLNGKKVDEIPLRNYLPGSHTVLWRTYGLKPGNYICVLKNSINAKSYKVMILK